MLYSFAIPYTKKVLVDEISARKIFESVKGVYSHEDPGCFANMDTFGKLLFRDSSSSPFHYYFGYNKIYHLPDLDEGKAYLLTGESMDRFNITAVLILDEPNQLHVFIQKHPRLSGSHVCLSKAKEYSDAENSEKPEASFCNIFWIQHQTFDY